MRAAHLFAVGLTAQVLRILTTMALILWATRLLSASDVASFLLAQGLAVLAARFVAMGASHAIARVALDARLDVQETLGLGLQAVSRNSPSYGLVWLALVLVPLGSRFGLSSELGVWLLTIGLWGLGIALSQVCAEAARSHGHDFLAAATHGVAGGTLAGVASLGLLAVGVAAGVDVSGRLLSLLLAVAVYSGPGLVLVVTRGARQPSPKLVAGFRRQARPAGLAQLLNFSSMEALGWVAVLFLGDVTSASIMLAARLAAQASMPCYALSTSIGARSINQIYGDGDQPGRPGTVPALYGAIALFCIAVVAVTAWWPDPVELFAGSELAVASDYVPLLVLPSLILGATGGASQLVQMTDMAGLSVKINSVIFGCSLALQMIAAYRFGPTALVMVFSASLSAVYLSDYLIVRGKIGFDRSPVMLLTPKGAMASASASYSWPRRSGRLRSQSIE